MKITFTEIIIPRLNWICRCILGYDNSKIRIRKKLLVLYKILEISVIYILKKIKQNHVFEKLDINYFYANKTLLISENLFI